MPVCAFDGCQRQFVPQHKFQHYCSAECRDEDAAPLPGERLEAGFRYMGGFSEDLPTLRGSRPGTAVVL